MATPRDNLAAYLRDAYAMEHQAIEILERQDRRLEHYPELRAKVREHLAQTRRQAERVRECLRRLGTDTSAVKTALGKAVGTVQELAGVFVSDEVLKSALADYAFEHYEAGAYRMLMAAAEEAGEPEVARVCAELLREEEAQADWLARHLPELMRQFLRRAAAGQPAKR